MISGGRRPEPAAAALCICQCFAQRRSDSQYKQQRPQAITKLVTQSTLQVPSYGMPNQSLLILRKSQKQKSAKSVITGYDQANSHSMKALTRAGMMIDSFV